MNTDIRVELGFFTHRKTRRLIAKFTLDAAWGLEQLWAFAARYKPSGFLTGMTNLDIASEMHMEGKVDADELVKFMLSEECRWLDMTPDGIYLHDWTDHQPWAAGAEDRSDMGRFSRLAHINRAAYDELKSKGINAISKSDYEALTTTQRTVKASLSPTPTPTPTPAPAPRDIYATEFEIFWNQVYPHRDGIKTGRHETWAAFQSINESEIPSFMQAARNFAELKKSDSFGIPDAVRFIVKGRGKHKFNPWKEYVQVDRSSVIPGGSGNGKARSGFESRSETRERELRERHPELHDTSERPQ